MLRQGMPPVHLGEVLKEMYLDPMGSSVSTLADTLGVTRQTLSKLARGRMRVSMEMAVKLAKAIHTIPELSFIWISAGP
jgi:antitoxin HigA-1